MHLFQIHGHKQCAAFSPKGLLGSFITVIKENLLYSSNIRLLFNKKIINIKNEKMEKWKNEKK